MKQLLTEWSQSNSISDTMIYKNAATGQVAMFQEFAKLLDGVAYVISTHRSKSITLPVVEVETAFGTVRARDNFHDIKVTIDALKPCDDDLFSLLAGSDSYLHPVYFEGFKSEWIFPPFIPGATKFSTSVGYRSLSSLARALRWFYSGKNPEFLKGDELIEDQIAQRELALRDNHPVLFRPDTVCVTYRFFDPGFATEPDEVWLREALTRQAPSYDGKIKDAPIPYLELDFSGGLPRPTDAWLTTLNKLIIERRTDPKADRLGDKAGCRVNVNRLTPELRARAESLGLMALLVPPDHH